MFDIEKVLLRPVWFEIDLDAIQNNFVQIQKLVGNKVKIIVALKGDAYGFGCLEVAEVVISAGAYGIAVADLYEGVNLRNCGIKAPILLYANNLPSAAETVLKYDLIPTVTNLEAARMYSIKTSLPLKVFIKVDIGLNRVGVLPKDAVQLAKNLVALRNIHIAGIYTHFHFSENNDYIDWQFNKFKSILLDLSNKSIDIPIKMASATPTIVQSPHTYLNAVDPGRLIFGNPVVTHQKQKILIKPVFRALKTKIIERKIINPSKDFQNNAPFPVHKDMVIGVLPIGWGDGYSKKHSFAGSALVHGKRVALLNGISFEHTRIDLTHVPETKIGDEVVLIGKQKDEEITLNEVVKLRSSDMHEVCQSVRKHIPRIYYKDKKPYKLVTTLGEIFI